MPDYNSYESFKRGITWKLHSRNGFDISSAKEIATNIVERVKNTSGGGLFWKSDLFTHGKYQVSHYDTLRGFLNALENISIPTNIYSTWQNRQEFKALQAKFHTTDAIEAVNAFTEKYEK